MKIDHREYDLSYLSFGAGVQSSALLVMACLGLNGAPPIDVALFADTGDEPAWVYDQVDRMKEWALSRGVRVETVRRGCLSQDLRAMKNKVRGRFAAMPCFVRGKDGRPSMLRRQCTREYKIEPIERRVRELLGVEPRHRVGRKKVRSLIGISSDEIMRMKPSRTPWITTCWPLVDARMTRRDCLRLLREQGLPEPKRSSCVFCPFHGDAEWEYLRAEAPDEFEKAVGVDHLLRDMGCCGGREPVYLHRSLRPLEDVDFNPKRNQMDLFAGAECEGMCGV